MTNDRGAAAGAAHRRAALEGRRAAERRLAAPENDNKYYLREQGREVPPQEHSPCTWRLCRRRGAGAVSKIDSESMYKKETGTLALMLERWHADDRAEL